MDSGDRLLELLEDSQVEPELLECIPDRLSGFVEPFTRSILQAKQRQRAAEFIGGLLSDVERKNAESIAYRHDQERKEMQYSWASRAGSISRCWSSWRGKGAANWVGRTA